eukprot:scaffold5262_cov51-Phaeocystis_antarctica.AAC.4
MPLRAPSDSQRTPHSPSWPVPAQRASRCPERRPSRRCRRSRAPCTPYAQQTAAAGAERRAQAGTARRAASPRSGCPWKLLPVLSPR